MDRGYGSNLNLVAYVLKFVRSENNEVVRRRHETTHERVFGK